MSKRTLQQPDLYTLWKIPKRDNPKVIISPVCIDVIKGTDQTLSCTFNGLLKAEEVQWIITRDATEHTIDISVPGKYSGGTLEEPTLTINDFDYSDTGRYVCRVTSGTTTITSQESSLQCIAALQIEMYTQGKLRIGHGGNIELTAAIVSRSSDLFNVSWQKIEKKVPRCINLNNDKYEGSCCDDKFPKLVINEAVETDDGNYRLEVTSATETVQGDEVTIEVFGGLSKEENNFIRFYLLCQNIATDAVRMYFDRKIPQPFLVGHLRGWRTSLISPRNGFNCTLQQQSILYPASHVVVNSAQFDFTLLYKLIKNTVHGILPTNGWGPCPYTGDVLEEDDIERIHHYRNDLSHNTTFVIAEATFKIWWKDLSEAISRLSNNALDKKVKNLYNQTFNQLYRHQVIEDLQQQMNAMHQRLEEIESRHIPVNIKEIHSQLIMEWKSNDMVYYDEINGYKEAWKFIETKSIVTIIGAPGCGKTAMARHIALQLENSGWEVVPVFKLEDIISYSSINLKQVFVLDDVLGIFSIDMSVYIDLEKQKNAIFKVVAKDSKLIVTSRKYIQKELEQLKLFIFQNIVDLQSNKNDLNEHDKKKILSNHCKHLEIEGFNPDEICLQSANLMFPFLCKLFSQDEDYRRCAERFFNTPFECILSEMDKLRKLNKMQYATMVLCLLNNNTLSSDLPPKALKHDVYNTCEINKGTADSDVTDALDHLTETYLTKSGEEYKFIHDSIFEILGYHYGKKYPKMILKYMSLSFLSSKLSTTESKEVLSIVLERENYEHLANRLIKGIDERDLYNVFRNKSLSDARFLQVFMSYITQKPFNGFTSIFLDSISLGKILVENIGMMLYKLLHDEPTRVIRWVVYCGHSPFLQEIVQHVESNQHSLDEIFGTEIAEETRLLTVGCFGGDLNTVKLLLKYVKRDCINRTSVSYETPLTTACSRGYLNIVELLLEHNAEVNATNGIGESPLHKSSENGHYEVLQYLQSNGANVNMCNIYGESPLHTASENGHYKVVMYLVENGADVNPCIKEFGSNFLLPSEGGYCEHIDYLAKIGTDSIKLSNEYSETPLQKASGGGGYYEVVKYLVEKGADVNLCNEYTWSPLHKASGAGHYELVKYLVENGANVNKFNEKSESPLHRASSSGHYEIVQYLAGNGGNVNQSTEYIEPPLHKALRDGHFNVAKLLVEKGANVNLCNEFKDSPLHEAASDGGFDVVKCLIEIGADINLCNEFSGTPLHNASMRGNYQVVKYLVEMGADVNICNKNNGPPLFIAALGGIFEIVKYLVESGANVNLCNEYNESSLFTACEREHFDVVKYLVENGADVNLCDIECRSPLFHASREGHYEIVKFLVEHGANVNLCDDDNETPLQKASESRHFDIVKCLVENGANVNLSNTHNESPLHKASLGGYYDIVKYLTENGADVHQINDNSESVLYKASGSGYYNVVRFLVEKGADVNLYSKDIESPLLKSSGGGHYEVVTYLVGKGADVNVCDKNTETPLYRAFKNFLKVRVDILNDSSRSKCLNIIECLLSNGSDCNFTMSENIFPLHIAILYNLKSIVKKLVTKRNQMREKTGQKQLFNTFVQLRKSEVNIHLKTAGYNTAVDFDISCLTISDIVSCIITFEGANTLSHLLNIGVITVKHFYEEGGSSFVDIINEYGVVDKADKVQILIDAGFDLKCRDNVFVSIFKTAWSHFKGTDFSYDTDHHMEKQTKKAIDILKSKTRRYSF